MSVSMGEGEEAAILQRDIRNLDTRSLDVLQAKVEAAWHDELNGCIDGFRGGAVELLDLDESHREIRGQLIARRK